MAETEYVPTLAERIAEAIPTELTATAAVGIGGARRLKIAHTVLPTIEAELAAARADERAKVAEEIAKAIEDAHIDWALDCLCGTRHAAIARQHATAPAESAARATEAAPAWDSTSGSAEAITAGFGTPKTNITHEEN